ncbi:MAG: oligosaccharide flippase family protein [Spirochaetia bacterium]|nr:oligosaccharide flippase family protein [Spirochaetia bacterium]
MDSIKKRYFYKLAGKLMLVVSGLVIMTFVPRTLGPKYFGQFQFITNNMNLIFGTLSLSVPVAYFNWVSKREHTQNSDLATGLTMGFVFLVGLALFLFILLVSSLDLYIYMWPDIDKSTIWYGYLFAFSTALLGILNYLSDGKSLTGGQEKRNMLASVLRVVILFLLYLSGTLTLTTFFGIQIGLLIFIFLLVSFWLFKAGAIQEKIFSKKTYEKAEVKEYILFVSNYASPLALYSFFVLLYGYFDPWFLQWISGSVEQGFYGIAFNLGSLIFVFSGSMTPIIIREYSYYAAHNNIEMLRKIFHRVRIFFILSVSMSMYFFLNAKSVINITGGEKYADALPAMMIMCLYPVHQTLGQLSSSLFLSRGATKEYSKIGIYIMLTGIPATYLFLAPKSYFIPGMELGALGLALKMVIINILSTNVFLYLNAKFLKISYWEWAWFQIKSMLIFFLIGFSVRYFTDLSTLNINIDVHDFHYLNPISPFIPDLIHLTIFGMIYFILTIFLVLLFPKSFGLYEDDLKYILLLFRRKKSV